MTTYLSKILVLTIALQLALAPLASAADESCVPSTTAEPPFLISDNFMMQANQNFENLRALETLAKVTAHIPKRTIVRALPQERQRHLSASRDGRYVGVEVLGLPEGAAKPASGNRLGSPKPGDKGFIHFKSLVRPAPGTQMPKGETKYHFDPTKEAAYVFEVKADSPFFPMIDDGKVKGGEFLKPATVGEKGRELYKTEECCQLNAAGAREEPCRTKYFFAVVQPNGSSVEPAREVSFDVSGACSIVNVLDTKMMSEIRDLQGIAQKILAKPIPRPPVAALPSPAALAGNPQTAKTLGGTGTGRGVNTPTAKATNAPVKSAPTNLAILPRVPSLPASPSIRAKMRSSGTRFLSECRGCKNFPVGLASAALSGELQRDALYSWNEAPYGSVHYYRADKNQKDTNLAQPLSMCGFLVTLREYSKKCSGPGCTVFWGDFYSHPNERYHESHGTAECVDILPMYKDAPEPGNFRGSHTTASKNYDRDATRNFIALARANGASDIYFCDAKTGPDMVDCGVHANHVHICFKESIGKLPPECTEPNEGSAYQRPEYGDDACYASNF